MSRTTDEWAALLDGTTPEPWEVETVPEMRYYDGETWETPGQIVVSANEVTLFVAADEFVGDEGDGHDNEKNVRLAAAAPDAVAEVVRLRRKIIALRDSYAAPDDPGDDYGRGMEAAYQIAADDLTRILEGEA